MQTEENYRLALLLTVPNQLLTNSIYISHLIKSIKLESNSPGGSLNYKTTGKNLFFFLALEGSFEYMTMLLTAMNQREGCYKQN